MLKLGTRLSHEDGTRILEQGNRDEHVVVLLSGVVKVVAGVENGDLALLAIRVGGDVVGELAAYDGNPRSATVIACGEVVARSIPLAEWKRFVEETPKVHTPLLRMGSERFRWADQRRVEFFANGSYSRVARVLVELAKTCGWTTETRCTLPFALTAVELGSLAGIKGRTAERHLHALKKAGLMLGGSGQTVLPDVAKLRDVADSGR
ncbi:Crp/Fnr family transcriptional regulator [Umezawaea sp. Da 62-37]|uniref:Crp/Fnr family transcriptional regulator n=1 Tax=Umezawaea sp. Da 62-37 TaxID=3075927 RepID=UPI0028F6C44A|nr:Crp/Fnr family transcriptional regulator [Umezawaea sp. Da 62-37]WNV82768.1 Crp/Fnr family transcriptional regulator [Umezawaea sp. Da 62-37]